MSTIIKSSKILTENGFIDGFLIHENGKIIEITKKMDSQEEIIDYGDKMIIPGLFETHNHGVYGYLLRDTGEDMEKVIEGYLKGLQALV